MYDLLFPPSIKELKDVLEIFKSVLTWRSGEIRIKTMLKIMKH